MKKHEKHLSEMLQSADMETIRRIADSTPAVDMKTKERIFKGIQTSYQIRNAEGFETEAYIATVESGYSRYRSLWTAAACLLVCGGVVGGLANLPKPMTTMEQNTEISTEAMTEAISTAIVAPANNPKTAEKSAKETDSAQPKETTIETVPVNVPVVNVVPVAETVPAVNAETVAQTAKATTVQTTAIPSYNATTKETVSAELTPLVNNVAAENVTLAQENTTVAVETSAPIQTTSSEITTVQAETTTHVQTTIAETTTNSVETTTVKETKPSVQNDYLGGFRIEKEEKDNEIQYHYYVDGDVLSSGADLVEYGLTYIPDGFKFLTHFDGGGIISDCYSGEGDILFKFSSLSFSDNCVGGWLFNPEIKPDGEVKFSYESTTVNDYPALLTSNDDEKYSLYWHDGTQWYQISTEKVSVDEIMKMAESVQPVDAMDTKSPVKTEIPVNIENPAQSDAIQLLVNKPIVLGNFKIQYNGYGMGFVEREERKESLSELYQPEYVPDGAIFNTPKEKQTSISHDIQYDVNNDDCNVIYVNQSVFGGFEFYLNNDSNEIVPVTINGYQGFTVSNIRSKNIPEGITEEYIVIWEQDDYLFQIWSYNVSDSYKSEILKMAESLQPVK